MKTVLAGLNWETCLIYLNDIIVVSKCLKGVLDHVKIDAIRDMSNSKHVFTISLVTARFLRDP